MLRIFALFCIVFLYVIPLQAQDALFADSLNFAEDSLYYLEQLEKYIARHDEDAAEKLTEQFRPVWFGSYYSEAEKDSLIAYAGRYDVPGMRAIPHFLHYYQAFIAFAQKDVDKTTFSQWFRSIMEILNKDVMRFGEVSRTLKSTRLWINDFILMERDDTYWKADTAETNFAFENDTLYLDVQTDRLTGYIRADSLVFYDAKGRYNMSNWIWYGKEGRLSWQKMGIAPDSVYVELGRHQMDTRWVKLRDQEVSLFHKGLLRKTVSGSFRHQAVDMASEPRYPEFRSDSANLFLNNIFPGVDYVGGLYFRGSQMIGKADGKKFQTLIFRKNEQEVVKARAKSVLFGEDQTIAENARVSVYFHKDSLYHNKINLRFYPDTQRLELLNPTRGRYRYLFSDSRHEYDIDAGLISWNMNGPRLRFKSYGMGYKDSVIFQSSNYMSRDRYQAFLNRPHISPVDRMMGFAQKIMEQTNNPATPFTVGDVANYLETYPRSATNVLYRMQESGFVIKNEEDNTWRFASGFFKYYAQVKGKEDYDRIRFKAEVMPAADTSAAKDSNRVAGSKAVPTYRDTAAAVLNIFSGNLQAYGVDSIPITTQVASTSKSQKQDTTKADKGESQVAMRRGSPDGKPKKKQDNNGIELKNVSVKPADGSVSLSKGRNFLFDGQVNVGDFLFVGSNFRFDYENFTIDLDSVEYMTLSTKMSELKQVRQVENKIENLSGFIKLGDTTNRAGDIIEPLYPRFVSEDSSYVYYNDSSVMQITYPKEEVYFQIDPYDIDSMNRFAGNRLKLAGTFHSGDILPPIRDSLRIMVDTNYVPPKPGAQNRDNTLGQKNEKEDKEEDKEEEGRNAISFGFFKETEEDGLPIYADKATLHKRLRMTVKGLIANGTFRYRNAYVTANNFEFTTSQMSAQAMLLRIDRKHGNQAFPVVDGYNLQVKWLAEQDSFIVHTIGDPDMKMNNALATEVPDMADYSNIIANTNRFYSDTTMDQSESFSDYNMHVNIYGDIMPQRPLTFRGSLVMTPDTLTGNGQLEMLNSNMGSPAFAFTNRRVSSRALDSVRINAPSGGQTVFSSADIALDANLEKMKTRFSAGRVANLSKFPALQYETKMSDFLWDMNKQHLQMDNESSGLEKVEFISLHPGQNALKFKGADASLNFNEKLLTVNQVDRILVADAAVLPSTPVKIREDAKMDKLENAEIHTQNADVRHQFFNASAKIFGSKRYKAEVDYTYTDKTGIQSVFHFDSIYAKTRRLNKQEANRLNMTAGETKNITYGTGSIGARSEPFRLSPNFDFYGSYEVDADQPFLKFTGKTRPVRLCDTSRFFRFASRINPENIVIPFQDSIYNASTIGTGFYIKNRGFRDLYSSFVDTTYSRRELNFLTENGYLTFNEETGRFSIFQRTENGRLDSTANLVVLNKNSCDITGLGQMDFHLSAPGVELISGGKAVHDYKDDNFQLNGVVAIDFLFNPEALTLLLDEIRNASGLKTFDPVSPGFLNHLMYVLPENELRAYKNTIRNEGLVKVPPKLQNYKLVLADLTLKWDPERTAFVSQGAFAVTSVNGKPVNRYINGVVSIQKQSHYDRVNIDLKIAEDNWYFFRYNSEKLLAISSNEAYNTILRDTRRRKRKARNYEFDIGQNRLRSTFIAGLTTSEQTSEQQIEEDFSTDDLFSVPSVEQNDEQPRRQIDQKDVMPDVEQQENAADTAANQGVTYPSDTAATDKQGGEVDIFDEKAPSGETEKEQEKPGKQKQTEQEDQQTIFEEEPAQSKPEKEKPGKKESQQQDVFEESGGGGKNGEAQQKAGQQNGGKQKQQQEEEPIFEEEPD